MMLQRMGGTRHQRGLSLLELMVALALGAFCEGVRLGHGILEIQNSWVPSVGFRSAKH